jgi:hypothetical protein
MKITRKLSNQIVRCWQEGWLHDNIAYICKTDVETVEQVLKDKGILM